MRIITGSKRGKKLITLEGEQVRPTTDRVKESLFNILQFQLEGRRFLDLFAGSGQIGLEALSRGAAAAVFVDSSKDSIRVVQKNLESTGFQDRAKVVQLDFASYLRGSRELFDIAFLKQHHDVVVMMPEVVPNGLCGQFILFCKLQLPLQILYIFADQFHFVFITQRPNRPENHPQHRAVDQHKRCE